MTQTRKRLIAAGRFAVVACQQHHPLGGRGREELPYFPLRWLLRVTAEMQGASRSGEEHRLPTDSIDRPIACTLCHAWLIAVR